MNEGNKQDAHIKRDPVGIEYRVLGTGKDKT